ncbi:MAG: DUF1344 domain-containing protein [Rhodobacteraceae bacterium]|nr:DUF1344 domain-containing protein [Paracoccaceae bacterium]
MFPAILVLSAGLAGAAFASPVDVQGRIKAFDESARTVTLDNGKAYVFPQDFDWTTLHGFRVGDKVVLVVEQDGSQLEVQSIAPAA